MSNGPATQARARQFRRAELASFLRARRAEVRPEDVGLPAGPRRRTPGLRREEVAVLAQVGVSWYTWMEQGRELTVSPAVLDGIARALRLTPSERTYLFEVAGAAPPVADSDPDELARITDLVESMAHRPVYAVDRYWNVLVANRLSQYLFGIEPGHNCLTGFFTNDEIALRYPFREIAGSMMVAQFRAHAARFAGDPGFEHIVEALMASSAEFQVLWDRHVVGVTPHVDLVYDHPHLGRLTFLPTVLTSTIGAGLRLFVYAPKPGTPTTQALERME